MFKAFGIYCKLALTAKKFADAVDASYGYEFSSSDEAERELEGILFLATMLRNRSADRKALKSKPKLSARLREWLLKNLKAVDDQTHSTIVEDLNKTKISKDLLKQTLDKTSKDLAKAASQVDRLATENTRLSDDQAPLAKRFYALQAEMDKQRQESRNLIMDHEAEKLSLALKDGEIEALKRELAAANKLLGKV